MGAPGNSDGDASPAATCEPVAAPECPGSTSTLSPGSTVTLGGDSRVNSNLFEPSCASPGTPEVHVQLDIAGAGSWALDTSPSTVPVVLAIFDGCTGAEIACFDDPSGVQQAEVTWSMGDSPVVLVEGRGGACGEMSFEATPR